MSSSKAVTFTIGYAGKTRSIARTPKWPSARPLPCAPNFFTILLVHMADVFLSFRTWPVEPTGLAIKSLSEEVASRTWKHVLAPAFRS